MILVSGETRHDRCYGFGGIKNTGLMNIQVLMYVLCVIDYILHDNYVRFTRREAGDRWVMG